MSQPGKHHFLPEFYLKGFCLTGEIWVYDREKGDYRKLCPGTVAVRRERRR